MFSPTCTFNICCLHILTVYYAINPTGKSDPYWYFSGQIALNYKTSFETDVEYFQIIEDKTTPNAVLLAEGSAVVRMYSNGTTEVLVGKVNAQGYVWVFIITGYNIFDFK